jgi:hypothetical protein
MNMETGTEAAQFPEKKHINGIFVAMCNRESERSSDHSYMFNNCKTGAVYENLSLPSTLSRVFLSSNRLKLEAQG